MVLTSARTNTNLHIIKGKRMLITILLHLQVLEVRSFLIHHLGQELIL